MTLLPACLFEERKNKHSVPPERTIAYVQATKNVVIKQGKLTCEESDTAEFIESDRLRGSGEPGDGRGASPDMRAGPGDGHGITRGDGKRFDLTFSIVGGGGGGEMRKESGGPTTIILVSFST